MSELTDRVIAALRANHDALVALVPGLTAQQLTGPSGASEWSVAQVLSHLGSGAEISRKPIATAAGEQVEAEDNQSIWARWDGSSPSQQAAGYVEHDTAYLDTVEALTAEQRDSLRIDMGFLPEPVPVVVGLGPQAEIDAETAAVLVELYTGPLAFLLGFSGKPDLLDGEVRLAVPGGAVEITDKVVVSSAVEDPTAVLAGPDGSVIRL